MSARSFVFVIWAWHHCRFSDGGHRSTETRVILKQTPRITRYGFECLDTVVREDKTVYKHTYIRTMSYTHTYIHTYVYRHIHTHTQHTYIHSFTVLPLQLKKSRYTYIPTLNLGLTSVITAITQTYLYIFIHSFIPAISIAPLQVFYYTEALPTTARILYRSFTPKRTGNCR